MSMSNVTITNDGPKIRHDDDTLSDAASIPFYQWSFLGGWKPVCIRHNLIFMRPSSYEKHWTPVCEQHKTFDLPEHDMLARNRSFKPKRVWS